MATGHRVASALELADVDAILRVIEGRVRVASTIEEAIEIIHGARRGLAEVRVEVEAENILIEAAGDLDGVG